MTDMYKHQKGNTVLIVLLAIIVVAAIGFVGYGGLGLKFDKPAPVSMGPDLNDSGPATIDETFSVIIDPMVGGGIAGAVNTYEITASGKVFQSTAPDYKTEVKKSLIKNVASKEIQELRQTFIDSGVLDIAPGNGPQYSGSAWKVTINGKTQSFYDQTSSKFDSVKTKLKTMLGENVKI